MDWIVGKSRCGPIVSRVKERKPNRSWDDVFPDAHLLDSRVQIAILASDDRKKTPANHEHLDRSFIADSHDFLLCSFSTYPSPFVVGEKDRNENDPSNLNMIQTESSCCLSSLEKDIAKIQARLERMHDGGYISKSVSDCPSCAGVSSMANIYAEGGSNFQDLLEDIFILELEVAKLEHHLLQIYRQVFTHIPHFVWR
ncbi:hypothetical protein KP509_14G029900 [Ceratopteris richardii]|uniref:Ternary complex factor MIP1 leucine-zipper domain-containing protein n=1 Tax=Ceratopteris richardii TaxID=49495 RepID=A0A8T2TBA9_CERRI|nr:hypothetical protein KP509_14G029900 [Ceratopteris richardii]